ncbi:glycosyltransferase family 2 protein [bacterium]|nr:MAG: glycosyltransferase family 2 protein [bacterium]
MKVSLASPVYNEGMKIQEFIRRAVTALKSISEDIEIVLVDDCSPDNTLAKIKELLPQYPFIKLIHLNKNSGQHIATSIALKHTTGDYVYMMDSDLQVDPERMTEFFEYGKEDKTWDIISASRITRSASFSRRIGSKIISLLLQKIGGTKLKDIGSTFKLLKRKALDRILAQDILVQNLPILMMNLNFTILEYSVEYNSTQTRKSHYKISDLIYAIALALLNFSTGGTTLVLLISLGILFSFLGSASVLGIIVWGIVEHSILPTNLLIFSSVLAIVGIQFMLLAMVVFKLERINKNLDFRRAYNQRVEYEN